jgi:hypothetical protein
MSDNCGVIRSLLSFADDHSGANSSSSGIPLLLQLQRALAVARLPFEVILFHDDRLARFPRNAGGGAGHVVSSQASARCTSLWRPPVRVSIIAVFSESAASRSPLSSHDKWALIDPSERSVSVAAEQVERVPAESRRNGGEIAREESPHVVDEDLPAPPRRAA